MKKFLLSTFVTGSFILYSLSQRNQSNGFTGTNLNPVEVIPTSDPALSASLVPSSSTQNTTITNPPASTTTPILTQAPTQSGFKNGQFVGDVADAYFGNIQVQVAIQNGQISGVDFLQYPNDRGHSVMVNNYAMPILRQEAIQAQSANVDIVSGATDTSQAFIQSLASALAKAR